MTIEELTSDIEKLEALTDAQLAEYFAPYLNTTRPELAAKSAPMQRVNNGNNTIRTDKKKENLAKCREMAQMLGIKLDI